MLFSVSLSLAYGSLFWGCIKFWIVSLCFIGLDPWELQAWIDDVSL